MNLQTNSPENQLNEVLNDFISSVELPENEKQELFQKLGEAVVMNFTGRMISHLKDDDRNLLSQINFGGNEETFNFFKDKVSLEITQQELGKATEEILERFLTKIEQRA